MPKNDWEKASRNKLGDRAYAERMAEAARVAEGISRDTIKEELQYIIGKGARYDAERDVVASPGNISYSALFAAANAILLRNDPKFIMDRARGEMTIRGMSFIKLCNAAEIDPAIVIPQKDIEAIVAHSNTPER